MSVPNFHLGQQSSHRPSDDPPDPRQPSFDVGLSARAALSSRLGERLDRPGFRCLSAAGFRFSDPPLPAGELGLPHGRLTGGGAARPHRGFHVPHDGEAIGVGAFWTPGPWCSRWGQDTPQVKVAQYCRVIHRLRQPWLTTLQTKVPRVTRPIFTSPGLAGWFGIALGFSSCFAPDDYSSRTRRR